MTTIVYRNGVMVSDSRAYSGGALPIGAKSKIQRLNDGTLVGVSTITPGGSEAIMRWVVDGCPDNPDYKLPEKFSMIMAKLNGSVYLANDALMLSGPLMGEMFAIGTGSEYALGAMKYGASPIAAVEIACQLDVWSSEPIYCLTHEA
jgi:hypothetical protein